MPLRRSPALRHLLDVTLEIAQALKEAGRYALDNPDDPLYFRLKEVLETITPTSMHLRIHPYISCEILPPMPPTFIRYLEVFENTEVSIGVFVLPPGGKIPLHDHPEMCVVSQLLHGTLHLRSFNTIKQLSSGGFLAREAERVTHTAPCISALFPSSNNIHCFEAGPDGCSILDVLIPPYGKDGRHCSYYAEFTYPITSPPDSGLEGDLVCLQPFEPPESFAVITGEVADPNQEGDEQGVKFESEPTQGNGHTLHKPDVQSETKQGDGISSSCTCPSDRDTEAKA